MNLKSYSRGIGAGLVVAALVLGLGAKENRMSDADVKKRAMELGMVESSTLSSINNNVTSTEDDKVSDEVDETIKDDTAPPLKEPDEVTVSPIISDDTDANSDVEDDADTTDANDSDDNTDASVDSGNEGEDLSDDSGADEDPEEITPPQINPLPEEETGFVKDENGVSIVVIKGDSSVSVARRLFEAGLVESAVEFDKYLCSNGYDKVISVGEYEVPYDSDFETIAKIITRRK